MEKGHLHQIFLDKGPLASESVPVLKFQLCPSPLVLGAGARLWFQLGTAEGQSSLLLCMPSLNDLLYLKSD